MKPGAAVIAFATGYELVALTGFTGWLWVHLLRAVVEAKS